MLASPPACETAWRRRRRSTRRRAPRAACSSVQQRAAACSAVETPRFGAFNTALQHASSMGNDTGTESVHSGRVCMNGAARRDGCSHSR